MLPLVESHDHYFKRRAEKFLADINARSANEGYCVNIASFRRGCAVSRASGELQTRPNREMRRPIAFQGFSCPSSNDRFNRF